MINSDPSIQQALQDQLQSKDPFQKAQALFQQQNQGQAMPEQATPDPSETMQSLFASQPRDPAKINGFKDSGLADMVTGLGLSSDGLMLNQVGRMQLQGRLQHKFGPLYADDPKVKALLAAFDSKAQGDNGSADNDQMASSVDKGKRTLSFLMGQGS